MHFSDFGIAPSNATVDNFVAELLAAKSPADALLVAKNYLCAGMRQPAVVAALTILAQKKDPQAAAKALVIQTLSSAAEGLSVANKVAERRKLLQCQLTPFLPVGSVYDNIPCVSGDDENWVGNARACDTHDYTDYDIYGMAEHWWRQDAPLTDVACAARPNGCAAMQKDPTAKPVDDAYYQAKRIDKNKSCCFKMVKEPPRSEYCGPLYGTRVGDRSLGITTKSGLQVYMTLDGKYYTTGPDSCRARGGKDWRAEEVKEVSFLLAFDKLMSEGKKNDAFTLMTAFFLHKSTMRHQWVTKVPGFVTYARPVAATNGRYTYLAARYRYMEGGSEVTSYFYLPNEPSVIRYYRNGADGRFNVVEWGDYGKPGYVCAPPPDASCKSAKEKKAVTDTVKWVAATLSAGTSTTVDSIVNFALTTIIKEVTKTYIKSTSKAAAALMENQGAFDLSLGMSSLVSQWNDIEEECIVVAERKAEPTRALVHAAVKRFTDPLWPKVNAGKTGNASAPPLPTVNPATGGINWGVTAAGAAAGAAAAGPVGGVLGAIAGAILGRKK